MTLLEDVCVRLSQIGCRPVLDDGELHVRGPVEELPADLLTALRKAKPALIVEILRQQADRLRTFLNGEASYEDRLARIPEYMEVIDRLAAAQEVLFASWRRAGFAVVWSGVVEEFILVGDSPVPAGSKGTAVYSWQEVRALKDASPLSILWAHRIKKAFTGTVRSGGDGEC